MTAPSFFEASELEKLSEREAEVISLLMRPGQTRQDVASKLCITEHTVKFHLINIYRKWNVASRREAAAVFHTVFPAPYHLLN